MREVSLSTCLNLLPRLQTTKKVHDQAYLLCELAVSIQAQNGLGALSKVLPQLLNGSLKTRQDAD